MLNLSEYLGMEIKGNGVYNCLISPSGMIIKTFPENGYLVGKDIQELYAAHKGKLEILRTFNVEPPLVLDSDKYRSMVGKNGALRHLLRKFECDIL